jgi:hypothetical protein
MPGWTVNVPRQQFGGGAVCWAPLPSAFFALVFPVVIRVVVVVVAVVVVVGVGVLWWWWWWW